MSQHRKRRRRHGRRPLHVRFIDGVRGLLFPRSAMAIGLPHDERGKRGQIIAFAIVLVLMVIGALTVIAAEGGFSPSNPVPVEE